jgi:hypothetical protein
METTLEEKVKDVKKRLTKKRIEITETKAEVDKLGEKTKATMAEDLQAMFLGKLLDLSIRNRIRAGNVISG